MSFRKHGFSMRHEQRNGRVSAIGYGGLVRVLEPGASVGQLAGSYFVLEGAAPADPTKSDAPAHVGCGAGGLCTFCTGSPKCSGPPPPAALALADGLPGARTILVKRTASIEPAAPGGWPCLFDTRGDRGLRVPIFDEAVGDLSVALDAYRAVARIRSRSLAFHLYAITSAPVELDGLRGKRIAIPVLRGAVRSAAAVLQRRA